METDVDYFVRRAAEEACAAKQADTDDAAQLHRDLAERYSALAEIYRADAGQAPAPVAGPIVDREH
jgi:hypothetical protein